MEFLWERLEKEKRPIAVYGTGDGADKLFSVLESKGLSASAVFASDGFVRSRFFHGFKVLSFDQADRIFGPDMLVLMAFGSHDRDVIEHVRKLDSRCTLLIPDLLADERGRVFDREYLECNLKAIERAYSRLSDERSRSVFRDIMEYRATGRLEPLLRSMDEDSESWKLLGIGDDEVFFDGGAYNGDTVRRFLSFADSWEGIYAAEPDPRSFRKLSAFAGSLPHVRLINAALDSKPGKIPFTFGRGRGNRKGGDGMIDAVSIDSVLDGNRVSIIKLDVEGEEENALLGARRSISAFRPHLAVSAYHRIDDLWKLPDLIDSIEPGYQYRLRRSICIPCWDAEYFCI